MNEDKFKLASKMLCGHLRDIAKAKGMTHDMIVEKTGFTQGNISRMFSGKFSPSLDNFLKLAEAVDAYIFVSNKDADDDLVKAMKERWGKVDPN